MDDEPGDQTVGLDAKKKSLRASEQNEAARTAWREQASQLPTQELVVVDETGSQINMTPLYAYAPRGERAIGKVPAPLRGESDRNRFLVAFRDGRSHVAGWISRCGGL